MKHAETSLLKMGQVVCLCLIILTGVIGVQDLAFAVSGGANVLFILDGSGSMWGRMDNVEKIVIAKDTMSDLVQDLPESFTLGLMVYGHRRKGDCDDIELLSPLGQSDPATIIKQIQSITPKGKTPITKSIQLAGQQLEEIEEETTIVLVSDGKETCEGDPCDYVRTLKDMGIDFTMHVVGFDVNEEERKQLACIADAGGGRYFSAQNAMQLKEAFEEVKEEVVEKAEVVKKVEPSKTRILFEDDFSNSSKSAANWEIYDAKNPASGPSEWGVRNGELWQTSNIYRGGADEYDFFEGTHAVTKHGMEWTDYEFTVSFRITGDDDGVGVLFRYRDPEHYYRCITVQDSTNRGPFRRLQVKDGDRFITLAESSEGYDASTSHTVTVKVVGEYISIFFDGQEILSGNDRRYSSERVGLQCYAEQPVFDNVRVTSISSK